MRRIPLLLALLFATACGPEPSEPAPPALGTMDALGRIELRIEVRPALRYPPRPPGMDAPRLRDPATSPWHGLPSEFDVYLREEIRRWRQALETGTPYVPSRPDMYVVSRFGTTRSKPEDFVVVERGNPEERFGSEHLEPFRTDADHARGDTLRCRVRAPYRDAFERWTRRNVGLPMAFVFNGEVRSTPTITAPIREILHLRLDSAAAMPDPPSLEADADGLFTLPDLRGWERKRAESLLRASGLVPIITLERTSSADQVGRVLRQRPEAGQRRGPQAMIFLTIGEG